MSTYRNACRWLLSLSAVLFLATVCQAQRPVQILYFSSPANAPTKAFIYTGEGMVAATELPRSNFSQTFEIPIGDIKLAFFPELLEEGMDVPEGAPSLNISEKWQKILLLVFEDENNKTMPIRVQAINASESVFAPGSICMINFSEIGLAGTIGDKKVLLKPRAIQIIKKPSSENGYYRVKLDKYLKTENQPKRFIRQMWGHDNEVRQLLFILPKPAPIHATYYCAPIRGL